MKYKQVIAVDNVVRDYLNQGTKESAIKEVVEQKLVSKGLDPVYALVTFDLRLCKVMVFYYLDEKAVTFNGFEMTPSEVVMQIQLNDAKKAEKAKEEKAKEVKPKATKKESK